MTMMLMDLGLGFTVTRYSLCRQQQHNLDGTMAEAHMFGKFNP